MSRTNLSNELSELLHVIEHKINPQPAMWKVEKIIDGNSIEVSPGWKLKDKSGNRIRINGYKLEMDLMPAEFAQSLAKDRLKTLIDGKEVQLNMEVEVNDSGELVCSVYLDGIDISKYFLEFRR